MSTLIVGSGLSGLITAINIKTRSPHECVVLIDKPFPEGNSFIAGERIRAGIASQRSSPVNEIVDLLARRNQMAPTKQMEIFAETLMEEISFWHQCGVPYSDKPYWFGPQWGDSKLYGVSRSHSLIRWFRNKATSVGIIFYNLQVVRMLRNDSFVSKILAMDKDSNIFELEADNYVLAGGSATGLLFSSTNRIIHYPPQLLAYEAGIPLSGSTVTMAHPFGFCSKDLLSIPGCYETDAIADHKVYNVNGHRLRHIEDLLRKHQAHYRFPQLCSEIWSTGGGVSLVSPNNTQRMAMVSVHYNQLGIQTNNGVCVKDMDNLYAVGDASGLNYWTNHKERFPGFAIGNCLVSGRMCADIICEKSQRTAPVLSSATHTKNVSEAIGFNAKVLQKLREVNTKHLLEISLFGHSNITNSEKWGRELANVKANQKLSRYENTILSISKAIAYTHQQLTLGDTEPITILK